MGGGRFLLLSYERGYLREQLEIEGLTGYFEEESELPQELSYYDLIIVNGFGLKKEMVRNLLDYAYNGGLLFVIRPCENFEDGICLKREGVQRKGWLHDDYDDNVYQVFGIAKYKSQNVIFDLLKEGGEATEYSLIFQIPIGAGKVYVLAFDFSQTMFSLLQGRDLLPDEKDEFGIPRVDFGRLVEDNKRFVPQVDGLRRILVRLIEDNLYFPIPRLWYFPNRVKGGIAFTHDSDASNCIDFDVVNELDLNMGLKATTFMMVADGNPRGWKKFVSKGLDLQFHPILNFRVSAINSNRLKAFTLHLPKGIKRLAFYLQKRILEIFSTKKLIGVRNHGLVWPRMKDYFNLIKRLGILYDSTLGSNYYFGYMYGTGFPYFLRFPDTFKNTNILEIPLHIMDSVFIEGFGQEWKRGEPFLLIKKFLDESIERYNSMITINFHHFFLLSKVMRLNNLDLYRKVVNYVKKRNFFIINLTQFNTFWRKRLNTRIVGIRWNRTEGKLTFGIKSNEDINGLTYLLPVNFREGLFLRGNGESTRSIVQNGREYRMYRVDLKADILVDVTAQYTKF
jgi:hypothetical protein